MKKSLSIILVLILMLCCTSCDLFTPPDYTVYLLNPYFKEKPDWVIDNTSPEYQDDAAEQTKEFYVEELGKTVTLNFDKVGVGKKVRVCVELMQEDQTTPSYTGKSNWFTTKRGTNKITLKLEEVQGEAFEEGSGKDPYRGHEGQA